MKVLLVAGPRNEELIREILDAKARLTADPDDDELMYEWMQFVSDCAYKGDEYMDALYYACENGDDMLAEQARYFHDCLLHDEVRYYAARMGGYIDFV